jgi:hypothetical protein
MQTSTTSQPSGRLDRWSLRVALGVLGLLSIVHLVIAWSREWTPSSDWASMEMRVRDVGSLRHGPLYGAWSRNDWAHPGPLVFYVLALPYRLLGADAGDLRAVTVLINAVALGLTLWLLRRRSVTALLIGGPMLALMLAGIDAHVMSDYWNATITVMPTALVLVAAWSALDGDRWGAPLAIVGWTWLLQCHFGYGTVTAIPVAVAVIAVFRQRPERRRMLAVTAVGALATFIPVAVDVVAHWPGNLGRAVRWNLTDDQVPVGFDRSARVIARASSWTFLHEWRLPAFDKSIGTVGVGALPGFTLVVLAAGVGAATRVRRRNVSPPALARANTVRYGGLIVAVTWLLGFAAIARIRGELLAWIVDWLMPLTALTWAIGLLGLSTLSRTGAATEPTRTTELVSEPLGATQLDPENVVLRQLDADPAMANRPSLRSVLVAVAALVTSASGVDHLAETRSMPYVNAQWGEAVSQFADEAWATTNGGPVFVEFDGEPRSAGAIHAGLVNEWERRGGDVRVPTNFALQMGGHRTSSVDDGSDGRTELLVRLERRGDLPVPPGASVIAVATPLTDAEQTELDALSDDLTAALTTAGLDDRIGLLDTNVAIVALIDAPAKLEARRSDFERVTELRQRGERFVLYQLPAG